MKKKLPQLLQNSVLVVCLVSLTGCGRQGVWRRSVAVLSQEERARIHDLSFPLNVYPTKILFNEKQMVLSFTTELSSDELIKDYHAGMEYWGWNEIGTVQARESALIFIKPTKVCTVIIRPEGSLSRVTIFSTIT